MNAENSNSHKVRARRKKIEAGEEGSSFRGALMSYPNLPKTKTMDRYQKVEKTRADQPIDENEILITSQGRMRSYITYAMSLLQEKGSSEVVFKAMGRAINKTVTIVELIKKRIVGLHQITSIGSTDITDTWEPLEEGLFPLETTRHVSMITITLSKKELNTSSIGYQPPLLADQVESSTEFESEGGFSPDADSIDLSKRSVNDKPDSPDISLVIEKGQVACRDSTHCHAHDSECWTNLREKHRSLSRNMDSETRIAGLHQITSVASTGITNTREPLEEGMLQLDARRPVSPIAVTLSNEKQNMASIGHHQSPLLADQVEESTEFEHKGEGSPTARGRSRGENGREGSGTVLVSLEEDDDGEPLRSIFCLKNKSAMKDFEDKEDCFILGFNPDVDSIDFCKLSVIDNPDSPDISVVAEKGQVACRDYPHSRHLCVKHPFDKSLHQLYCELCYCYVCDVAAPCKMWTSVFSGHCHAHDSERWTTLREEHRSLLRNNDSN